jgi:hypothetical protein
MDERTRRKPSNADQLRAAIDSGASADKVAFPDPSAAPLGTDAEAAGAAPSAGDVSRAHAAEADAALRSHQGRALPLILGFLGLVVISTVVTVFIFAE